jgi:branched-subunit amino acid transport protein
MKTSDAGIWVAILMLSAIIVLLRALYLYAPRRWQPRGAVARALRYAPMAAIVAVVAPEVAAPLREAGRIDWAVVLDPRLLSALALLVVGRFTGSMLIAIAAGAAVLLLV